MRGHITPPSTRPRLVSSPHGSPAGLPRWLLLFGRLLQPAFSTPPMAPCRNVCPRALSVPRHARRTGAPVSQTLARSCHRTRAHRLSDRPHPARSPSVRPGHPAPLAMSFAPALDPPCHRVFTPRFAVSHSARPALPTVVRLPVLFVLLRCAPRCILPRCSARSLAASARTALLARSLRAASARAALLARRSAARPAFALAPAHILAPLPSLLTAICRR